MNNFPFDSIQCAQRALTLHGPADLVAAVPHLLGFAPKASIVAVFIKEHDQCVHMTLRADVPTATADGEQLVDLDAYLSAWSNQLDVIVAQNSVARVVLAAFADVCESGNSASHRSDSGFGEADDGAELGTVFGTAMVTQILAAVATQCETRGIYVFDQLVCGGGRWRSVLCSDIECCPAEGTAIDQARGDRIAAEFIFDGVCVQTDQEALTASLAPLPDTDAKVQAFRFVLDKRGQTRAPVTDEVLADSDAEQRCERAHRCVDLLVSGGGADPEVALALADVRVRDAVIRLVTHDLSQPARRSAETCLIDTMRLCPRELRAPVVSVAAGLAWQRGDGATASRCVAIALDADPGYSLARLLQRAIRDAVPPQVWVNAVAQTSVQDCLTGMPTQS